MVSSEERREVAARLRERERGWRKMGTHVSVMPDMPATQFEDIAALLGFNGWILDADIFARLADLIDPATSATAFTPGVGLETYPPFPIRLWKCARCGEETIMMYDEGEPVACPYCGAVVVSEHE